MTYIYEVFQRTQDEDGNFHEGPRASIEVDVPDTPLLNVDPISISETEGDPLQFEVFLDRTSAQDVEFDYRTRILPRDTAEDSPNEFIQVSGTDTITAGTLSKIIEVITVDDPHYEHEREEIFTFEISNAVNAEIEEATTKGTIIDNERPPLVDFPEASRRVSEGVGTVNNLLCLDVLYQSEAAFDVTLSISGTADAGDDFATTPSTLTFSENQTNQCAPLTIINDDVYESEEESLVVQVEPGQHYRVGGSSTLTVVTDDNDSSPTFQIRNTTPSEEGGPDAFFELGLTSRSFQYPIGIRILAIDGLAEKGVDYTFQDRTIVFQPDVHRLEIEVPVIDDAVFDTVVLTPFHYPRAVHRWIRA